MLYFEAEKKHRENVENTRNFVFIAVWPPCTCENSLNGNNQRWSSWIFLQTLLSVLMVQYNDIFFLIEIVGFAQACILATTYASMLYLRYKHPEIPRPIRVRILLHQLYYLYQFDIRFRTFLAQLFIRNTTLGYKGPFTWCDCNCEFSYGN